MLKNYLIRFENHYFQPDFVVVVSFAVHRLVSRTVGNAVLVVVLSMLLAAKQNMRRRF